MYWENIIKNKFTKRDIDNFLESIEYTIENITKKMFKKKYKAGSYVFDMGGDYADYDGPCPPWNDSIVHHYHFTVYAIDKVSLELKEIFDANDVIKAMEGHILEEASWVGTYSMNPKVQK